MNQKLRGRMYGGTEFALDHVVFDPPIIPGPPVTPYGFAFVQQNPGPALPGDTTIVPVSPVLGFQSTTGRIRLLATVVGAPSNFAAAPGVGQIQLQFWQDGGIPAAFVNALAAQQYPAGPPPAFGSSSTITFEWVANVDLAVHGYQIVGDNSAATALPGDTWQVSRFTLSVEDVGP